jgi:hypothetical protein
MEWNSDQSTLVQHCNHHGVVDGSKQRAILPSRDELPMTGHDSTVPPWYQYCTVRGTGVWGPSVIQLSGQPERGRSFWARGSKCRNADTIWMRNGKFSESAGSRAAAMAIVYESNPPRKTLLSHRSATRRIILLSKMDTMQAVQELLAVATVQYHEKFEGKHSCQIDLNLCCDGARTDDKSTIAL